jgi:hypothetical protein
MMPPDLLGAEMPLLHQIFPPLPLIELVQDIPVLIFAVLLCCLAVAYLALWRAAPDYHVFRSLSIYTFVVSVVQFLTYFGAQVLSFSVRAVAKGLLVEAAGDAMRVSNRRWTRFFWPVYIITIFAVWFPLTAFLNDWSIVIAAVPLGILIVQGFRQGNPRDRMVASAFLVYFFVRLTLSASIERLTGIGNFVIIGGWQWSIISVTQFGLGAATLTIFVRDLIRDRDEKQRMASELAAGRAVQQVLIPEESPTIPGFSIQCVYKPFGEVGGDFFQLLPVTGNGRDGGLLVIIGDVSGKGLPAAMTVALLVGTVQTLAGYMECPSEILAAMNHRMLTRSHGGFTTCLALRADPDGTLTIANAGHIAPYLSGQELALNNGLPLGISADATYAESTFQLMSGQQLTLLTDGVVEARDKTGALFGFEATAAISTQSANQIVKIVELFGQEDDITVLSLTRAVDLNPALA